MLKNAYLLAKIGADTAENNLNFVFKKLTTILQNSVQPPPRELLALSLAACRGAAGAELTSPGGHAVGVRGAPGAERLAPVYGPLLAGGRCRSCPQKIGRGRLAAPGQLNP